MLKIEELREIIELIDASSINEFSYETEGAKVKLKKQVETREVVQVQQAVEPVVRGQVEIPSVQPQVKTDLENTDSTVQTESVEDTNNTDEYDYEIVSPMVGTLYSASAPGKDPFVTKGSTVMKDSVVCIVEAMKLFNEIEAEVSGEVVEVLVEDGELVEYGQPLFRVKTK